MVYKLDKKIVFSLLIIFAFSSSFVFAQTAWNVNDELGNWHTADEVQVNFDGTTCLPSVANHIGDEIRVTYQGEEYSLQSLIDAGILFELETSLGGDATPRNSTDSGSNGDTTTIPQPISGTVVASFTIPSGGGYNFDDTDWESVCRGDSGYDSQTGPYVHYEFIRFENLEAPIESEERYFFDCRYKSPFDVTRSVGTNSMMSNSDFSQIGRGQQGHLVSDIWWPIIGNVHQFDNSDRYKYSIKLDTDNSGNQGFSVRVTLNYPENSPDESCPIYNVDRGLFNPSDEWAGWGELNCEIEII